MLCASSRTRSRFGLVDARSPKLIGERADWSSSTERLALGGRRCWRPSSDWPRLAVWRSRLRAVRALSSLTALSAASHQAAGGASCWAGGCGRAAADRIVIDDLDHMEASATIGVTELLRNKVAIEGLPILVVGSIEADEGSTGALVGCPWPQS